MTLAERLVAIHRALEAAGLPHAFGGAIALAYATLEPRGTRDIDVNVFIPAERAEAALRALPFPTALEPADIARVQRDGQTRLLWDDTPIDLFFDYAPIHVAARERAIEVPFAGTTIPVLGAEELVVFKAMFDRTKDWADIEAVFAAEAAGESRVRALLEPMIASDDHRWAKLDAAITAGAGRPPTPPRLLDA